MDPREIAELLHIHKESANHGGALNKIAGAAMNRLKQINDQITPDAYMAEQEPGAADQRVVEPEPVPERNVVPARVETGESDPTIVTEPTAEQIEAERVKQASIPRRALGGTPPTQEPSNG